MKKINIILCVLLILLAACTPATTNVRTSDFSPPSSAETSGGEMYLIKSKAEGLTVEREYNAFCVVSDGEIVASGRFLENETIKNMPKDLSCDIQILKLSDTVSVLISSREIADKLLFEEV